MIIQVKNTQYFEWNVPQRLADTTDITNPAKLQQLVDEYFDPFNSSEVEQISDDYYEMEPIDED